MQEQVRPTNYDYSGKEFFERPIGQVIADLIKQGLPADQAAVSAVAVHNMLGYLPDGSRVNVGGVGQVGTPGSGTGWHREYLGTGGQAGGMGQPVNMSVNPQNQDMPSSVPSGIRPEDLINADGSMKSREEIQAVMDGANQQNSNPQNQTAPPGYHWDNGQLVLNENQSPVSPPQ